MDAEYAQAQLRVLWATKGNGTLLNALNARLASLVGKTQDGTFLASTSAGGVSASFFSGKNQDPTDMAKLVNRLLGLYEQSQTQGYTDEADIYANMLFLLEPVTEFRHDHSCARLGYV